MISEQDRKKWWLYICQTPGCENESFDVKYCAKCDERKEPVIKAWDWAIEEKRKYEAPP